ncbi:MAG: hypothetical protein WBG86_04460 [Polyangiales bacterium]
MSRWMPVLAMGFCALMSIGCDEECAVGECVNTEECFDTCIEACDGEVVDAFCNLDEVCVCDCELGCF